MRAAVVRAFGGPEVVEIADVAMPDPGSSQIRIKVAAATLNPADVGVRQGYAGGEGQQIGLGWDVAGTVDAAGEGAAWKVGDQVVALYPGMVRPLGTHAEYVVVESDAVAPAPSTVDAIHASTLPLNALTAAQALELLNLNEGQSLLVTGAAGAVGGFAVQLAAHKGVMVTGMSREGDEQLVRSLGAVNFTSGTAEEGSFDAVLDAAVLGEAALQWSRDGGSYVGVRPGAEPTSVRGVRTASVAVRPDGGQLAELARLVDERVLTLRVSASFPLENAAKAHARLAQGGVRGRLVLVP